MKKIAIAIVCFLFSLQVFAQDTLQAKFSVVDVCDGVEAVFTNTSKVPVKFGGANYFWFFGDGTTSTDQFPKHTFTKTKPGEEERFEVKLVIQSKSIPSEKDSTSSFITIYPNPDASFTWDVDNKGNTQDVVIATQATTDTTNFYQWNLAGVIKSNDITPIFLYADVQPYLDGKNYDFTLLVRTVDMCESTYKATFNYNPLSVEGVVYESKLLYPNPVHNGYINFAKTVSNIEVRNYAGQLVFSHEGFTNQVKFDGAAGLYSVTANVNGTLLSQKLLVD